MIPFKIHHHAIDYLYCNIKCGLVNLTDSLKIMECNRYLYSTGKKKSIENIRRGVFKFNLHILQTATPESI